MRTSFKDAIQIQIECLSRRDRKLKKDDLLNLIATRITKGWAFTNQTREEHDKEVALIKAEAENLI